MTVTHVEPKRLLRGLQNRVIRSGGFVIKLLLLVVVLGWSRLRGILRCEHRSHVRWLLLLLLGHMEVLMLLKLNLQMRMHRSCRVLHKGCRPGIQQQRGLCWGACMRLRSPELCSSARWCS